MSDWGWVGLGYSIVYGTLGAYVIWLGVRTRRLRSGRPR